MAFITIGTLDQLQIQIPIKKTTGWADELREQFFQKVVEHDHSGNGKGAKLGPNSLEDNAITDLNVRLRNNEFLRSRNAADDADISILKVNASDNLEIPLDIQSISILGPLTLEPKNADPTSPSEGDVFISDGTSRPAGLYTYVGGVWLASPNNITASNQGSGQGIFIQKTGDDLEFKSLVSGTGISINTDPTTISINANSTPNRIVQKSVDSFVTGSNSSFIGTLQTNVIPGNTYQVFITHVGQGGNNTYSGARAALYNSSGIQITPAGYTNAFSGDLVRAGGVNEGSVIGAKVSAESEIFTVPVNADNIRVRYEIDSGAQSLGVIIRIVEINEDEIVSSF